MSRLPPLFIMIDLLFCMLFVLIIQETTKAPAILWDPSAIRNPQIRIVKWRSPSHAGVLEVYESGSFSDYNKAVSGQLFFQCAGWCREIVRNRDPDIQIMVEGPLADRLRIVFMDECMRRFAKCRDLVIRVSEKGFDLQVP